MKEHEIRLGGDFIEVYPEIKYKDILGIINYPSELASNEINFHNFLKNRILNSFAVQRMDGKGRFIIRRLFKAYLTNPRQLHDNTIGYVFKIFNPEVNDNYNITKKRLGEMRSEIDSPGMKADPKFQISLLRGICDHIAGMTDDFAGL